MSLKNNLSVLLVVVFFFSITSVQAENISDCGTLDTDNELYLLTADIYRDNQPGCFVITGENITLDFNGHTLYFTESTTGMGTLVRIGDRYNKADNSQVTNGRIIQQSSSPFAQGHSYLITLFANGSSFNNMYLYAWGPARKAITIGGQGSANHTVSVFNNTIIIEDYEPEAGHNQEGLIQVDFRIRNAVPVEGYPYDILLSARGTALIYNNFIAGPSYLVNTANSGPFGVMGTSKIFNNVMHPHKVSRNPYAIRFYHQYTGVGSEVYNNTILSNNSRGIILGTSSGIKVYDNYVDVAEEHIDGLDDYGVSFAFRMRYLSENNEIYGNTIKIRALAGQGISPSAFMTSPRGTPLANKIYGNTMIGMTETASEVATAFALDGDDNSLPGDYSLYVIENNTVIGNSLLMNFGAGNGPAHYATLVSSTIRRETPIGSFQTISIGEYENGNTGTIGHHLVDTVFENGADDLDLQLTDGGQPKELFLDWFLDIVVTEDSGPATTSATMVVRDTNGQQVIAGSSANAQFSNIVLNEYRMYSTSTTPSYTNDSNPYNVSVTYDGQTMTQLVTMDASKTITFDFITGPCVEAEQRQCGTSDVGACSFGIQRCMSGVWTVCSGDVDPVTEICENAIDDDCDNLTDYDDTDDCTLPTCTLPNDEYPCDIIDGNELGRSISDWYADNINLGELINIIRVWKSS